MGRQLMGRAMGDEHGVAGRQRVGGTVRHSQYRIADRHEMEPGMPSFFSEAQTESRTRLYTPVFDATQAHAAQQLVDEIRGKSKLFCRHCSGVLVKK
ncbi:hypothetical protein PFLmoz3_00662 [Pseudomonas fluorescens]|uniref:Uncharacterized protein n=1 Tax=Pseudomonas fluorescens TaxID=294 RepID=A0A109LL58_PSEFL|nr:hypothetical protein PFLmoz3_00662 [Pseudomonas fluorescens]